MNSMPKDFDQGLLQELECPVCMEYMKPPITMCENGHNICPNCKPKLNNCPSCAKPFLQVRNLALESLSRQFSDKTPLPQPSTGPQTVKCPFASISKEDCPWTGLVNDVKAHVKKVHNDGNDSLEANGVFNVILTGLAPYQHYRKAVFTLEELFYIYFEIKDGGFYCSVLYTGTEQHASKYSFKFVISNECDGRKISMSFPTRSILDNIDEILHSGDCVIINYNAVVKFLNANSFLECEFLISDLESEVSNASTTTENIAGLEEDTKSYSRHDESRRHRRSRRHERELNFIPPVGILSVIRPGRCVHGRRLKHCRICKYTRYLQAVKGPNGDNLQQNVSSLPEFYCAPSGQLAATEPVNDLKKKYNVAPSAPSEPDSNATKGTTTDFDYGDKNLYPSPNLLTDSFLREHVSSNPSPGTSWKCQLCDQIAPRDPGSLPPPGWHTATTSTGSTWLCKMCGQYRK